MLRSSLFLVFLFPQYVFAILSGWVQSPGYPRGYPPHASFNWSRCAPPGHVLSLTLTHLDLEDSHDCENDALQIMLDEVPVSTVCGQQTFEELQSSVNPRLLSHTGGCLSLSFHSDFSNVRRHTGFRGFYTVRDFDECEDDPDHGCSHFCQNFIGGYRCSCRHGYQLDTDKQTCRVSCTEDRSGSMKGVISSPSHPAPYAENARCSYTLSVEDHLQLELHFTGGFDVEQSPNDGQCIDSVTVETSSGPLGPFCGQALPPSPLLTQSSHIRILFNSDAYGSNTGFSIHYKSRVQTCPGLVTPHSSVAPGRPEHHHGDTVTVTCKLGRTLETDAKTLSMTEFKTTCQRTGAWSPVYRCVSVNCGMPDVAEAFSLQVVGSDSGSISTLYGDEIQFECGSKYYTLEGGDRYLCNASSEWVSVSGETDFPRCTEVCGKPEEDISSTGRIWGGTRAELGKIPWQLYIQEPGRGGASLINDGWAVTAAHVVSGSEAMQIKMYGGLIDAGNVAGSQSDVVVMDVKNVIIHSGYDNPLPKLNFDNDIALLRLSSRVELGPNLLPICLPEVGDRHVQENDLGTVSGWGRTEKRERSKILRYAPVKAYSLNECKTVPMHKTNKSLIFTEENMFCAGESGVDSCTGDSGGPFVVPPLGSGNKDGQGPYRLRGIVSWGSACQDQQFKGYYVNVGNYLEWIQETIEKVEKVEREEKEMKK